MKSLAGVSLILLIFVLPVLLIEKLRADYVNEVAIKRRHIVQPTLVMIGDSHIERGLIWGWRLNRDPFSIITVAKAGATMSEVMAFSREASQYSPKAYLIEVGDNDIISGSFNYQLFIQRYRHVVKSLEKDGTRVIVTLIPPPADPGWGKMADVVDDKVRTVLSADGARIIDLRQAILAEESAGRPARVDGIHLSKNMYERWAASITSDLEH